MRLTPKLSATYLPQQRYIAAKIAVTYVFCPQRPKYVLQYPLPGVRLLRQRRRGVQLGRVRRQLLVLLSGKNITLWALTIENYLAVTFTTTANRGNILQSWDFGSVVEVLLLLQSLWRRCCGVVVLPWWCWWGVEKVVVGLLLQSLWWRCCCFGLTLIVSVSL